MAGAFSFSGASSSALVEDLSSLAVSFKFTDFVISSADSFFSDGDFLHEIEILIRIIIKKIHLKKIACLFILMSLAKDF